MPLGSCVDYRLLSHGINRYILDADKLPPLLRSIRGAMFPNNMPGKSTLSAPSSDIELRTLKRRCASSLWALVPKGVGRLYFNGGLLRASPDSRRDRRSEHGKTEGSAAEVKGRDMGGEDEHRNEKKTNTMMIKGEKGREQSPTGSRSGSGSGSESQAYSRSRSRPQFQRTAPVPTSPNTGGLGLPGQQHPPSSASATATNANNAKNPNNNTNPISGGNGSAPRLTQDDEKGRHDHELDADESLRFDDDDEEILEEIETGILDVFGDAYCNKHLVYAALELILVRLLPELAEKGALELWAERIPM